MQIDANEFFRQATVRICSSLDIEIALKRMQSYVHRFIPARFISLVLFDPRKNVIRNIAGKISTTAEKMGPDVSLPDTREMRARWIQRHMNLEAYMLINSLEQDPDLLDLFTQMGLETEISFIMIRLELEGSRIGGLWVSDVGKNRYSDDQAKLLQILKEPVAIAMSNALQHRQVLELNRELAEDIRNLHARLDEKSKREIIGAGQGLKEAMTQARQVAGMDSPVLILGETGSGKEMIANYIHDRSGRKNGPFVKVNCGAIAEGLMDSELFGHEKGAFTGAVESRKGRFERAHQGTIFLDEIGELPAQAQVRLLRVLQEKTIERVGGSREISVDVRIISATHRNLREMVAQGSFREDLWFRLNVFPIWVPPLRERKEDIADLVDFFLHKKARELKLRQIPALDTNAIKPLLAHHWPGNVRELENLVERALIQSPGGPISFAGFFRKDTDFSPDLRVVEKPEKPLTLKDNGLFTKKCGKQIFRWSHQGEFIWLNGKTGPHSWPQNM
jgi:transcriptional regulator with GAF, ATPase, and Fis domain